MLFAASAPRPDCPVASAAGVRELLGDLLLGPVTPTCRLPGRSFPRPRVLAVLAHSRRRFCCGHAGSGTLPGRATRAPSPRDSVAQTTADSLGVGPSRV